MATDTRFEPRSSDIFLLPQAGTTWLKALALTTVNRAEHTPCNPDNPLRHHNPHDCVEFLEVPLARSVDKGDVFMTVPSPCVIATHMPYSILPGHNTAESSGGRIVYIRRNPKDAFVSTWLFAKKMEAATAVKKSMPPRPYTSEEVVGYWEESQRRPEKVFFLRYEEMLLDPAGNVRKLAEFMRCAFSAEEEAAGMVPHIVELCSLDVLKNMEVNKNGAQEYVQNESFFRKGVAGHWSNHMTPAMAARLDKIVEDALQGSGFTFTVGESDSPG
ncbi:LOW QUALITY PROTEIN: hypothetical protein BRADI_2g18491v3 [Brachypodium distachyon]|uniref:Sulfotransferase n=1 Tax=Brachypodium distachyon TaxID=15368 RepID=A0A0Q3G113_BRADI|nr:LOW QUALITY PROTEIN: hypothetical protein BRADI_2g18491v3 [Brachypodium distachyon]